MCSIRRPRTQKFSLSTEKEGELQEGESTVSGENPVLISRWNSGQQ
jgi:hypothetical protein